MQTITDYYQNEKVLKNMLHSIDYPSWHIWKVVEKDGVVRQNKKKINSIKKLKEFLGKNPLAVYVSVARFMNPHKVYGKTPKKAQYVLSDTHFIDSDLLFDVDHDRLETAHKDAIKIIKWMNYKKQYKLKNIRYSGNKGFHLLYHDTKPPRAEHPITRMIFTERKRKKLVNTMPELECIDKNHQNVITDQFRVHAAIGTVKAKTGHIVAEIPLEDLLTLTTKELTKKWVVRATRPMISNSCPDIPRGERSTLISSLIFYQFVDNMVAGLKKMYVPVLKFPKRRNVDYLIRLIQKEYNLPTFYKFMYGNIKMYICLKIVDKRRLLKIMRKAAAINLNSFMFYGHSWIPITEAVDKNGNVVWERPVQLSSVRSNYLGRPDISRPHANLLGVSYGQMVGNKQNKIHTAYQIKGEV